MLEEQERKRIMFGKIICWVVTFGCALLFYGIGLYAKGLKTPMWFWSGSQVPAEKITDVAKYNRANGIMWQCYSLWFVAAGVASFWSGVAYAVLLVLGGTLGAGLLVMTYQCICKRYFVS